MKYVIYRRPMSRASHAADGYARATGKVGVCIATSGPGATNLVTGIATAYMDSVPMVAITGQVATTLLGKDSFQEVDITGITMPITKHNFIVKDVEKLADIVRKAFYIAKEGRPGPVLIDICKDVTAAQAEYEPKPPKRSASIPIGVDNKDIDEAIKAINGAKKPVILSGGGVSIAGADKELFEFATKGKIPVTTTLMGMGTFPGTSNLFMGMLGMHGTRASNTAVSESDLFIAVGARFSDRVISNVQRFAPKAKIMHIDIDPAEIGKNVVVDYPLVGNIKKILKQIIASMEDKEYNDWNKKIDEWKELYPLKYSRDDRLHPHYIIERMYAYQGQCNYNHRGGTTSNVAAQFYKYTSPRQFLSSGDWERWGMDWGHVLVLRLENPKRK